MTIDVRLRPLKGILDRLEHIVRSVTGEGESLCAKALNLVGLSEALPEGRGGLPAKSAHLVAK